LYLKRALELDGGGPVSRYYYGALLYNSGRLTEASQQFAELSKLVPNAADFLAAVKTAR